LVQSPIIALKMPISSSDLKRWTKSRPAATKASLVAPANISTSP
jgi:hypothetical protein